MRRAACSESAGARGSRRSTRTCSDWRRACPPETRPIWATDARSWPVSRSRPVASKEAPSGRHGFGGHGAAGGATPTDVAKDSLANAIRVRLHADLTADYVKLPCLGHAWTRPGAGTRRRGNCWRP